MLDSFIKRLYMYYNKYFARIPNEEYTQLIYKEETVKGVYFTIITKNFLNCLS